MKFLPAPRFKPFRIYSDGAGTQSIAVMILQVQGKLAEPYDAFVFSNVGEDSEKPETLDYRKEFIEPYAAKHGLTLIERRKEIKGKPVTLYEAVLAPDKSIPIPIVFEDDQGHGNRKCTSDWKVEVVNRYCHLETGASHVVTGIGFSVDEGSRIFTKYPFWHDRNWTRQPKTGKWIASKKKLGFWKLYEFPLAKLRMNKADCIKLAIETFGEEPPPSLCWYCPFTPRSVWAERKRTNSPFYQRGIDFQNAVNEKYQRIRHHHPKASKFVGIHRDGIRLEDIPDQMTLWDEYMDTDESCQVGACGV